MAIFFTVQINLVVVVVAAVVVVNKRYILKCDYQILYKKSFCYDLLVRGQLNR